MKICQRLRFSCACRVIVSTRYQPRRYGSAPLTVSSVLDLEVYINSDVAMRSHVTATVRSWFVVLRQLRSVRRCLPQQSLLTLIRALIISKVDYCSSVLVGVSGHLLDRLDSVLNAASRLVFSARRSQHITPLLQDLHWLRMPERIRLRLCAKLKIWRMTRSTPRCILCNLLMPMVSRSKWL